MTKRSRRSRSLSDRFWEKVEVRGPDDCWLWTASLQKGYGQIGVKGQSFPEKAHRVSWILNKGPIPIGMSVLHKCDNPPCVNPNHLILGTQVDNLQDMTNKGRRRYTPHYGGDNPASKLDERKVKEIRRRADGGELHYAIADEYGVSRPAIDAVVKRKTWAWVR